MYLTKEKFIYLFKNNFYLLFNIPEEKFYYLFDAEPFLLNDISTLKEIIKELNNNSTNRYKTLVSYGAIRKAGNMFTYDKNIVPISINIMYVPQSKLFGKITKHYISCQFYAHTIDDYSMSAHNYIDFENNSIENILNNIIHFIKDSFEFLNEYTNMPNDDEFTLWWKKRNCECDFN